MIVKGFRMTTAQAIAILFEAIDEWEKRKMEEKRVLQAVAPDIQKNQPGVPAEN